MSNHITRRTAIAAAPLLAVASATTRELQDGREPLVVLFARHAEKSDKGTDPELTATGADRADMLARMLRDSGITAVHSTDYIRTRTTAAPSAKALGVEVSIYDPRAGGSFVAELKKQGGRHLVIGHSNTTTALVEAIGGTPGTPIDEPTEYDRLYVVTISPAGQVSTLLLRY